MHPTVEKLKKLSKEKFNYDPEIYEFPEGTKTAEDAAEAIGCDVSQIAKSVVMKTGEDLVLVLTSGSNRVSQEKLSKILGMEEQSIHIANPSEVKETTGWSIGGVPPFCHESSLKIFFDETLLEFNTVWAAAGTPKAVFPISPEKLLKLSEAEVADVIDK